MSFRSWLTPQMLLFGIGVMLSRPCPVIAQASGLKYPSHVSKYDFATPDDLVFSYMLAPLFESPDAARWAILKDLRATVGTWVDDAFAAHKIAEVISSGMPIAGQPPLKSVDVIVKECAKVLQLKAVLAVYVRNSEEQRIYSFDTSTGSIIVVTSGLLKLFDNKPDELRFMIGRELGHLKADHAKMRRAGFAILRLIQAVDASAVPDKFQRAIPTLALGRFLCWVREAEITADRAGLLCCQDVSVAYSALNRQLHGLPDDSTYLDPTQPNFDEDAIIRNFQQWQNEPFVKFIVYAKRCSADAPFIPDRLAALKAWAKSGRYDELINRASKGEGPQLVTVETVVLKNIATEGTKVYPYVVAKHGDGTQVFKTKVGMPSSDVGWPDINATWGATAGQPIFFEVWDSRTGRDHLLGGFCVQPANNETQYTVPLLKDWAERTTDVNPSFVRLKLRVESVPAAAKPVKSENGGPESQLP